MSDRIELTFVVPGVSAARLWTDWLEGAGHAAMTGADATGRAEVGAAFTAWGGYIEGVNLALETGRRFVQSWRTKQFPADAPDARLAVRFEDGVGGCEVSLVHTELPEGDGPMYHQGWVEHYVEPIRSYFGS